jgi:hypothetical protein
LTKDIADKSPDWSSRILYEGSRSSNNRTTTTQDPSTSTNHARPLSYAYVRQPAYGLLDPPTADSHQPTARPTAHQAWADVGTINDPFHTNFSALPPQSNPAPPAHASIQQSSASNAAFSAQPITGYEGRTRNLNLPPPPSNNLNSIPGPQAGSAYSVLGPQVAPTDSTNAPAPGGNGGQERRKSGGRTKSITSFPGYPPKHALPPDDLSCYGICQEFPASLQYEMLRPFIQRRWSAEEIFSSLPDDVQQYIKNRGVGQELGFLHKRLQTETQLLKNSTSADGTSNDFIKLLNAARMRSDGRPEHLRNGQSVASPPDTWRRRHGAGVDPLTRRYVMIEPDADPHRLDLRLLLRKRPDEIAFDGPLPPNSSRRASAVNNTRPAPVAPPISDPDRAKMDKNMVKNNGLGLSASEFGMLLGVQPPPGNQAPPPSQPSNLGKRPAPFAFDNDALPANPRSAPAKAPVSVLNNDAPGQDWETSFTGQAVIWRSLEANRGAANVPPRTPPQPTRRFEYPEDGLGGASSPPSNEGTNGARPIVPGHPVWGEEEFLAALSVDPLLLPPLQLAPAEEQARVVRGNSVSWNGFSDDPMGDTMGSGGRGELGVVEESEEEVGGVGEGEGEGDGEGQTEEGDDDE